VRPLAWLGILFFTLVLLLPTSQMRFHFVHETRLHGMAPETRRPPLTLAEWWSGNFQRQFQAWFDENLGLRGYFIKIDNQIGYTVFHEAWSRSVDRPAVGLNGFIYEDVFLDALNGSTSPAEPELAALAHRLRLLQDGLAQRGIAFVFLIAPSKAATYPEFVPPRFLLPPNQRRETTYARMLPWLRREGVRFVDGHALFKAERESSSVLLFPPGGIHWNRYGAHFAVKAIWKALGGQMTQPLVGVRCASLALATTPLSDGGDEEMDVEHLLNVVRVRHGAWKFPRPTFVSDSTAHPFHPRIVVIGDSFSWMLTRILSEQRMVSTIDYYYYFTKHFRITSPSPEPVKVPFDTVDWEKDILTTDAILLEVNEIQLEASDRFVVGALRHLATHPPGAAAAVAAR
jgi:hypothetical protein